MQAIDLFAPRTSLLWGCILRLPQGRDNSRSLYHSLWVRHQRRSTTAEEKGLGEGGCFGKFWAPFGPARLGFQAVITRSTLPALLLGPWALEG